MRRVALGFVRHPHVAADDGLDAPCARGLVELDHAEDVAQVRERERGHAIGGRRRDRFVETHHAVDDRILAMQTQVDEAGRAVSDRLAERDRHDHDVQFYSL